MFMKDFLISVVVPVYNEEQNIQPLLDRLTSVLEPYRHEIIFIDDGSTDQTAEMIKKNTKNKAVKYIALQRNFGHQMALACGYHHATGDAVITLDADLQDTPELLPDMITAWKQGSKIVYAQRNEREGESKMKQWTASLFYRFINILSDTQIPHDVGDFRLLDRAVVDFLNSLPEQSRFYRGLVAWGGFPATSIRFKREKRLKGSTHYTLSKMMNLALDGVTSFSIRPLRAATLLGFWSALLGFLGIIYALIGKFLRPPFFPHDWVTGWTGLFVGIMFLGGIQLLTIGIIGEYIGKIFTQVQQRPRYIVKETMNL